MTTTTCNARRPGLPSLLCSRPAGHDGDEHRASYDGQVIRWPRVVASGAAAAGGCPECGSTLPAWRHFRGCSLDHGLDEPFHNEEAVREVAWIARRARELSGQGGGAPDAEYAEFFARKVRLLQHIGTPDSLALVPANVSLLRAYREKAEQ